MSRPEIKLPRTRRGRALLLAAALAGVVGLYLAVGNLIPDLDIEALLDDFSHTLGAWTYLIVGIFALLETGAFVGLLVPGETIVVIGGAVAGQGAISIWLLFGIAWLGAYLGDSISYLIGRKLGRGFILRHGPRLRLTRERFAHVESYFERHGGMTILIGRFVGIVRVLAPFIAGSSRMRYAAMVPYSILGTGLWAASLAFPGYFASQHIDVVLDNAELFLLAFGLGIAAIAGSVVAFRYLRHPENRRRAAAEIERRPALRPVLGIGRRLGPPARFARNRLTPGRLGVEFTAPLAAFAVGAYVFVFYTVLFDDERGPTPGDRAAFDLVGLLEVGWLTSLAEALTLLGSAVALALVAVAAAAGFAWRRHWIEVFSTLAGVAIILLAVPELKDAIGRPRPADGLVEADGFAYPSGHAAAAVVYAWIAITVTIRIRTGIGGGTATILAGIALTAVVGLTRVYLGVHFLSDVSGGWALGACAFTGSAAIAVVVTHIRQNLIRGP